MVTKGKVGLYSFGRRPRKPSVNQTNIQSWVGVNKMVPSFPRLVSSSSSSFAEAGVFLLLLLFFFVSSSFSSSFFRTKNSVLTRRIVGTKRICSVSKPQKNLRCAASLRGHVCDPRKCEDGMTVHLLHALPLSRQSEEG